MAFTTEEMKNLEGVVKEFTQAERDRQKLVADAYFGTGGFSDGSYLWRHERESEAGFLARVKRREYRPFFRQVVDSNVRPVFSKAPDRRGDDPLYKAFLENADGAGNTLDQVIYEATIQSELQGAVAMVMDAPTDAASTLEASLNGRKFPWVFIVPPSDIEDYSFDNFGNLVFLEYLEAQVGAWKRFRSYLRVGGKNLTWTEDGDGRESERVEVPQFPYLFLTGQRPDRRSWAISPWGPLAEASQVIYNLVSLALTQEVQSTFNILTIQGSKGAKDLTLGENSVIYYPVGSEKPAFIAPDTQTLKTLLDHLEGQKTYIYQIANQGLAVASSTASGESRKWSDRLRQERLAFLLRQVTALDNWISTAFHAWVGSGAEWSVRYSSSFEYLSLSEDLKDAQALLDLGIAPENARRVRQDALLRKFSDADTATREEIVTAEEGMVDYPDGGKDPADDPDGDGAEDRDQGAGQ